MPHKDAPLKRYLQDQIKKDLKKKMVLVAGPRQCGKTTMSLSLEAKTEYLNYDSLDDQAMILARNWDRKKDLIVFDELHKMPKWKAWLKGVYDKEKGGASILVTGSARLNAFKKTGESLAGRHYHYRLHPLDLKELSKLNLRLSDKEKFHRLTTVGGYPEPFLSGDENEYRRWRQTHIDVILRQDLADYEHVQDLRSVEVLVQLLRSKVGSGISANALATQLQKDPKTVQRWLNILEDLFVIFRVTPYSKNIARGVKKEPKFYFFDTGLVQGEPSQKLENLVACSLLKECHYRTDAEGRPFSLHYLKVKGGREIDFLLMPEDKRETPQLIEVKSADADASPNFKLFQPVFKNASCVQLVHELKREYVTATGIEIRQMTEWLSHRL